MSEAANEPVVDIKPGEIGVFFGEGPQKGRLVLVLGTPAKWTALDPQNAAQIAADILEKARLMGVKIQVLMPRPELSPIKYQALVKRAQLVLTNQLSDRVPPTKIAQQLVDIILGGSERL